MPSQVYDRSFLITVSVQMAFVLSNTLLAHYARWIDFLGGSVGQVGWIMGSGAVLGLVLRPWLGQWINRFGPLNTWQLGFFIFLAGTLGNLFLVGLGWEIYFLRALLVLGAAFVFASSLTYVTQVYPVERRTEVIGILGAGGFIGFLTGPLLGDLILGSGVRTRADFMTLFVVSAAVLVIPAALLLLVKKPPLPSGEGKVHLGDFLRTVRAHWPGTILLVDLVFGICLTVPLVFLANYIDVEGIEIDGFSEIGLYFLGYAGWGFIVRVGLRRVPDQRGRRKVLLVGMLFMGVGEFAFLWVSPEAAWRIVIPGLLCGTGHALMYHTMTSLTLESFPSAVRGSGSALTLMMLDLGLVAGAPLLGWVAGGFGYDWLYVTVGSTCLVVALLYTIRSVPVWQERRRQSDSRAAWTSIESCGVMGEQEKV